MKFTQTLSINSLSLRWSPQTNPHLHILDQQLLPQVEQWVPIHDADEMIEAIQKLKVRGAPLIGLSAAFAVAQMAQEQATRDELLDASEKLIQARPTAVNLTNILRRLQDVIRNAVSINMAQILLHESLKMAEEDYELCEAMATHGSALVSDGDHVLTHCNTGGLATLGIGTALGVIRRAHELGKNIHVYVSETRPLLQGARLTSWELQKLKIPYTLITDNMAGHLMGQGKIQKVFVGCDRIATNGDFANKIGTYSLAVLAHYHKLPFFVVGPSTTLDKQCDSGDKIPIEQRDSDEVRGVHGAFGKVEWAPSLCDVYNPSFDVTPASLVSGWIMDQGVYTRSHVLGGAFV